MVARRLSTHTLASEPSINLAVEFLEKVGHEVRRLPTPTLASEPSANIAVEFLEAKSFPPSTETVKVAVISM